MTQSEQIPPSDQAAATEPAVNHKSEGHSRRVFLFKLSLLDKRGGWRSSWDSNSWLSSGSGDKEGCGR